MRIEITRADQSKIEHMPSCSDDIRSSPPEEVRHCTEEIFSDTNIRCDTARDDGKGDDPHWGALEYMNCGCLLLDMRRNVLYANSVARRLFEKELGATAAWRGELSSAFRLLLDRAGIHLPPSNVARVVLSRERGRPIVANQIGMRSDGSTLVVLLDLDDRPVPDPINLRQMFGLTLAEARLAVRMARGDAPCDVAREQQLSKTTIRSQLASIFAKTQTCRQAELVALLSRLAVLR